MGKAAAWPHRAGSSSAALAASAAPGNGRGVGRTGRAAGYLGQVSGRTARYGVALAMALAAWLVSPPGAARADAMPWGHVDALATGATRPGPAGWLNRCMARPEACRAAADAAVVPADPATLKLIDRAQRETQSRIVPEREPPGRDLWLVGPQRGDCEDFALTKQALLLAAGLPRNAVRLATVELPSGEAHAVLTVETTRGTLVLDNLEAEVVPMSRLRYRWLAIEEPSLGLRWKELQGKPGVAALQLPSAAGEARKAPAGGATAGIAAQ